MNKLKGMIKIELTSDEFNYINELIDRDTERPMKEYNGSDRIAACPVCGKPINKSLYFCGWCGQRYDNQNYEL